MTTAVNAMSGALEQLRAMAAEAAGRSTSAAQGGSAVGAGDFASALKQSLDKVSDSQKSALSQAHAFEMGNANVSLSDVMIDMQKANINFQTAVQVRNKLVSAYSDIMQMQV